MKRNNTVIMICEGAIMVALSTLLGFLKLWELPQGGSICLIMLPIFIYSWRWGPKCGLLAGLALGIIELIFDGAYAWSWQSMLGDYIVAFAALGISGFFWKQKGGLFTGMIFGALARFICHFFTGVFVWAEYMPDVFFGIKMTSAYLYSLLYNGSYILLSLICCLVLGALLQKPLRNRRLYR